MSFEVSATRQRLLYIITDYVMINLGWFIFNILRYFSLESIGNQPAPSIEKFLSFPVIISGQICFPLMMILLFAISGYYNNVFFKSRLDEFLNTIGVSFICTLLIYFIALINDNFHERMEEYHLIMVLWLALAGPCLLGRTIITTLFARKVHSRKISFNTLVIGTTRGAVKLASKLDNMSRSMGFNIVGYVDPDSRPFIDAEFDRPVYPMSEIRKICEQNDVKHLIVVPHRFGVGHTINLLNSLLNLGVSVHITPDMYQVLFAKQRIFNVAGEPLINISASSTPESTKNIKRMSDIFISAITLVVISPLLGIIALLIKKSSPGPILYRQERVGYHKVPFKILKFRSMYVDAETSGPALSSVDDPRITPIGRFLRKYRLDELPQFWNVLIGDMSLVGPRPEREYYVQRIIKRAPCYSLLHQVRPGITSWGMVKYGYASNVDQMVERMRYDLLYIDSVSLVVDLKILFYTVITVVTGKGV